MVSTLKEGEAPYKMFKYMRACYGIVMCLGVGVVGTYLGRFLFGDKPLPGTESLSIGSRLGLMRLFKGAEPNLAPSRPCTLSWAVDRNLTEEDGVILPPSCLERLNAGVGDLLYLSDTRSWLGGLKSAHGKVVGIDDDRSETDSLRISEALSKSGRFLTDKPIRVEKVF